MASGEIPEIDKVGSEATTKEEGGSEQAEDGLKEESGEQDFCLESIQLFYQSAKQYIPYVRRSFERRTYLSKVVTYTLPLEAFATGSRILIGEDRP